MAMNHDEIFASGKNNQWKLNQWRIIFSLLDSNHRPLIPIFSQHGLLLLTDWTLSLSRRVIGCPLGFFKQKLDKTPLNRVFEGIFNYVKHSQKKFKLKKIFKF